MNKATIGGTNTTEISKPLSQDTIVAPENHAQYHRLRMLAESYPEVQETRIKLENRVRNANPDKLATPGPRDTDVLEIHAQAQKHIEETLGRALVVEFRHVAPPAVVAIAKEKGNGIGEQTLARLLGHLGHPRLAYPTHWEGDGAKRHLVDDPPFERTISQLWSYCGVGDPTRKRYKGMTKEEAFALGSPTLKKILFIIASSVVMTGGTGRYRRIYDEARAVYDNRLHQTECIRCGPSGHPASVGSPWSKAHQDAAAKRKVAKELLRDLWRVT